jgi:hypothetical protein
MLMALLTAALVASLSSDAKATPPGGAIRDAVAFIVNNPACSGARILVPPNVEGPAIAEFVVQTSTRPNHFLIRPGKLFARRDWFGQNYSLSVQTSAEMMKELKRNPVQFLIWHERGGASGVPHEVLMRDMLAQYPDAWHPEASFRCNDGMQCSTTVYKYVPAGSK